MTEIPRGITARELMRALHTDGFRLVRTRGSHRIYRHLDGRTVNVLYVNWLRSVRGLISI